MALASEAAYREIKGWIQSATVAPGGLIDEVEAAKRLGMSRTPVREALLRLQSEGFVEISRGKGIRVLPLSSTDMREIYQVISGLETMAVSLIAQRRPGPDEMTKLAGAVRDMQEALETGDTDRWGEADELFHCELLLLSGNRKLHAVGCQMRDFAKRAHMVAVRMQPDDYRRESTRKHAALVETLGGKSPADAASLHEEQRRRGEEALVGLVEKFSISNL